MTIEEFGRKVREKIAGELQEGEKVDLRQVQKNNDVMRWGIMISSGECKVSPTIYIENFYEQYEQGATLRCVVEEIRRIWKEEQPKDEPKLEFFKDAEQVKSRIVFRLVNRAKNADALKKMPHVKFLDLAACFCCFYEDEVLGWGMIPIYYKHQNLWRITTEEMMEKALVNTPAILGVECKGMEEILRELQGESSACGKDEAGLLVLSNKRRSYGAASILYPDYLKRLGRLWNSSFYILPSSVHEVILLPGDGTADEAALRSMIHEINETQVPPEERLSDSLYYYDRVTEEVSLRTPGLHET